MPDSRPVPNETRPAADHWRQLYPFAPHFFDLPALGSAGSSTSQSSQKSVRMHFVDSGPMADASGAGHGTCLFVHGNPTWSFYWRNLILGLHDQHRCVAVDHIGCGLSDKPQSYPYVLKQHTENLVSLIDRLDLHHITLVAHDWGGAIGLGAAVARRERFSNLVLLNTGAFPPPYIPWRIQACRIPLIGTFAIRGCNAFAGAALTMATERPQGLEPLVKSGLIAPYHDWSTRVAVDAFVKDIPWRFSHPTYAVLESLEKSLATLAKLPVQLIWGMKDWCFTPECLGRFRRHFPHARVLELAQAGHYVVEDQPTEVLDEIRQFLRNPGECDVPQSTTENRA